MIGKGAELCAHLGGAHGLVLQEEFRKKEQSTNHNRLLPVLLNSLKVPLSHHCNY